MTFRYARTPPLFLVAVSVLFSLGSTSSAMAQTTQFVDNLGDCGGLTPCHSTITAALEAAEAFAAIQVFPGVYRERLVFGLGKNDIVLQARTKALMPVIAAPGAGDVITLGQPRVQLRNLVLEAPAGSAIRNNGGAAGAGVFIDGNRINARDGINLFGCSSSTLTNNWIVKGGITLALSSFGCVIDGNIVEHAPIRVGSTDFSASDNIVRRNILNGGDIEFPGGLLRRNVVELNALEGGSINVLAVQIVQDNAIRQNVVRGGGIVLGLIGRDGGLGPNTIESNVVMGSPADGILVRSRIGGSTLIRRNTSIESAGCDINDTTPADRANTWRNNRFGTRCGSATE